MKAGTMQPATWDVLTQNNGGLSAALNPLVVRWERAAMRPPLTADTLTPWMIEFLLPGKSTLFYSGVLRNTWL